MPRNTHGFERVVDKVREASMRPRRDAAEYGYRSDYRYSQVLRFNEAAA